MPTVTKYTSNNLVTVSYPVREAVLDITHAEHALILMFSHEKVKMIKFILAQYNLGLYDAKQVVDTVIASAENATKEELKQDNKGVASDINWSAITPGTMIYVRDRECDYWVAREFIAYDQYNFYMFICADNTEGSIGWKYAKLSNDLADTDCFNQLKD